MRLKHFAPILVAAVWFLAGADEAQARYVGNLNLFVGQVWMDRTDWEPVDQQPEFGLMLAFGEERAPIHFAIDAFASQDEIDAPYPPGQTRISGSSTEFAIGVRKVWDQSVTRPHLGAGATSIQLEQQFDGPFGFVNEEDRAYGAWVDFGVSWRLASHLNLGIEARYSYALASLGTGSLTREVAAGGIHLGVLIGFGW